MICAADREGARTHDAYHRFVRVGRWSANALWKILVVHPVGVLVPAGPLVMDCDDTLDQKTGCKIDRGEAFGTRCARRPSLRASKVAGLDTSN